MKHNYRTRIRFISIVTMLFSLVLIGRLYSIQIVSGSEFTARAEHQYLNNDYSLYDRGTIYFTNKDGTLVPAATLKTGYTIAINPEQLTDATGTYEKLDALTPVDKNLFMASASKADDPYEEVAKQVDPAVAQKIQGLDITGLNTYRQQWRFYPGEEMAAHALGFVGYQGNDFGGRTGLERYYEDVLNRNASDSYVNFFAEIFSNIKDNIESNDAHEGDVITTIEPSVEAFLERELKNVNAMYHSQFTGGIIMNPQNGEIYAMAVDPTYDPNDVKDIKSPSILTDKLVEDVYEMGSIVKPLTMAAALDVGAVTPQTTYDDTGCIVVNSSRICNYDLRARGVIPMQQVLSQSLNVGAAWVEHQIGNQTFAKYMLSYGIGQKTGIDLPNEASGIVNNLTSPRDVEYATASFGQGIAMSPIETIRALAVLGNGGHLVTPHLAKAIKYENGVTKTLSYPTGPQVIKPETSKTITDMLINVFDIALANGKAKIPDMTVASKTGTAQIADPNGGGYEPNQYLHSFFGYFPATNPKFIIFLYTFKPQGVEYASETLTNSFLNLTHFLINYYEIPPDR
ncbi:MAG TPA: penicillin-binding protein 2 [Candidatus Paceibacterota bacterium]|nr:penicillin-binding protein 2 [Candidatus Paceibacterota bacterium]